MVIYFRAKKLQKVCSNAKGAVNKLGPKMGLKLMQRMGELRAAPSLDFVKRVPPTRCHELTNNRDGQLSVDLEHPYRLLFICADDPIPYLDDGSLDWSSVTEIEIMEITDTHQ